MSDEKRRAAVQFGSAAESYFNNEVRRLSADREMPAPWYYDATRVLNVAAGAGYTVGTIADAGISSVVTADAAPEMVATAVRECPVTGIVADVERPPLTDDVFDTAACHIATHHFPDPKTFVAEVARILKPGGVFAFEDNVAPEDAALVAFFNGIEVLRDPTYVELHPASRWREWFTAAGLSVETVETAAVHSQFGSWTKRTNVSPADRDELERRFREAPEETKELFDVEFDGDFVVFFADSKALVRTRTEWMSRVAAPNPRSAETRKW